MKEEALKLADELQDYMTSLGWKTYQAPDMIRRLVAELDKHTQQAPFNFLDENGNDRLKHIGIETSKPLSWTMAAYYSDDGVHMPTKPLSDEEIDDIWAGCSTGDDVIDMHNFARAIEERHGIK